MKFKAKLELNESFMTRVRTLLHDAPKRVHQHRVSVGIHENDAKDVKVDYYGNNSTIDLIEAASVAEFGIGNIPQRSFIRTWFDQHVDRLKHEAKEAMQAEYKGNDNAVYDQAKKWGEELAAWVSSGAANLEPLSPMTVAQREKAGLPSGPPLFATGQLVRAIRSMIDGQEAD